MKQTSFCTAISTLAVLLFFSSEVLAQRTVPRFEIGGQFSFVSLNRPATQSDIEFAEFSNIPLTEPHVAEPGLGARFTYNLNNHVALEAEGNFFPKPNNEPDGPGGHIYQAQFGVKAGKHFKKFGLFLKMRPGFVRFTKVSEFTGIRAFTFIHPIFGEEHLQEAQFRIGKATYPSVDVGGVVEFYPSRLIVTRFDVGDTIIRYGVYREPLLVVCPGIAFICPAQLFERPAETRHNLQFSAGVGFRF